MAAGTARSPDHILPGLKENKKDSLLEASPTHPPHPHTQTDTHPSSLKISSDWAILDYKIILEPITFRWFRNHRPAPSHIVYLSQGKALYIRLRSEELEDKEFLKRKLGLLSSKESMFGVAKKHKHTTATCSNILKTLHRPNKVGLLAEGGLSTSGSSSSFPFLSDLIQAQAFIYHLYTQIPHFYLWLTKLNCLLNIFTWMPQTHLKFNLPKMKLILFSSPFPSKTDLTQSSYLGWGVRERREARPHYDWK